MKKFTFYKVGGIVRDTLLGIPSKDIDYAVVYENIEEDPSEVFTQLEQYLKNKGYEIFLSTPDCFTIRAKSPEKEVADFVLARKEIGYYEGTRKPIVKLGTLYDDLSRRDFTINALAEDEDGKIIDYFEGLQDLEHKILRTPLDTTVTLDDDPLRILRGIRFSITKNFWLDSELRRNILIYDYENKFKVISTERIREELFKCFSKDTIETILKLNEFVNLRDYIFEKTDLWLKPTLEKK